MKKRSIDLHGLTVIGARNALMNELKNCPADVSEIEVVHGYHSGQAIARMVRSLSHPRVEQKIIGLNNGATVLLLKKR